MQYWWNKGLDKRMQNNLKHRSYSSKEVEEIHKIVFNLYHARLKAFKWLIIFFVITFLIALIFNLLNIEDRFIAVASVLFFSIIVFFIMLYAYIVWVTKEKNQFMRCLRIGYPELIEKYEYKRDKE